MKKGFSRWRHHHEGSRIESACQRATKDGPQVVQSFGSIWIMRIPTESCALLLVSLCSSVAVVCLSCAAHFTLLSLADEGRAISKQHRCGRTTPTAHTFSFRDLSGNLRLVLFALLEVLTGLFPLFSAGL